MNLVLVHIGKCGGSTVNSELKEHGYNFIEKHVCKVPFSNRKKYIIVIRNPISRFVSAFNWRYKLVVEDESQKNRFIGEYKLLQKFKTANNLAENIYNSNGLAIDFNKEYIHHLKEDINYYIGEFLEKCNKENVIAVITTETLNEDLKFYFNIDVNRFEKRNKVEVKLSDLAKDNLRKYYEKDYQCIDKLYEMNLISNEKYKKLTS